MKMRTYVKRFFLVLGIFFVFILAAMVAIPYLFKDELLAAVQEQINENVYATVQFEDASLSLFRHFPKLSLRLDKLDITGKEPFDKVQLVKADAIDFAVDLLSVTKSDRPLEVNSIFLERPSVDVRILENGIANYNIALESDSLETTEPETESTTELKVLLDRIEIRDGALIYDDRSLDMLVNAQGIQFEGKGDFTLDIYNFLTSTLIDQLTVEMDGITYLKQARVMLDAGLEANLPENKYTLKENNLKVNALELLADGFVALPEEGIDMDLSFQAPANDFRQLLSLIPNAYIEGYEDVRIDGSFSLNGEVKGTYSENTYPAIAVNAAIDQGSFKYPELPMGIDRINTRLAINKPQGDLDQLLVDIPVFSFFLGGSPFEGNFRLKTPMSDPDVDTRIKGQVDLAAFSKAFPMEGMEQMAGLIKADVQAKTRLSTIEREAYENVNMSGSMEISQLVYKSTDMPAIEVSRMQADFSPQQVNIPTYDLKLGKSDLRGSANIKNILAWFSPEKTMYGTITARSNFFDAGEWAGEEESSEAESVTVSGAEPAETPFDRFDFSFDALIDELVYDTYQMKDMSAKGHLTPNQLRVDNFRMLMDQSDIQAQGVVSNVWDYLYNGGILGGELSINSGFLDLNPFMEEDGEAGNGASSEEVVYEPIEVPANITMNVNARVDRLQYTDFSLRDMVGKLVIEDRQVILEDCRARGFDGDLVISGSYDTQNPEEPAFSFKYDLRRLDFQQTFQAFNTFQALAPIGKYMDGVFSSSMIMEGVLGKDFMPKFSSLNADGYIETVNAVVASFPPLKKVDEKLNLNLFNKLTIEDTRNWFEVKNGRVEVKEFDYTAGDVDMRIGGSHGIKQDIDYRIIAKIPRKLLESNPVGAAADRGLGLLREQAGRLGVDIQKSEFVNVQINLTGNIQDPKVGLQLLGGEGQATLQESAEEAVKDVIAEEKEKLQEKAEEKLAEGKQKVEEKVQQAKDSLEQAATKKAEELAKKAKEEAAKKAEEALGKDAKKGVEDIKKDLEDWNPFKKKKKKKDGN